MSEIGDGIIEAFRLIFTFDAELWDIIFLSFRVSGLSTIIASLIAIPLGTLLALRNFRGKKFITNIIC